MLSMDNLTVLRGVKIQKFNSLVDGYYLTLTNGVHGQRPGKFYDFSPSTLGTRIEGGDVY